VSPAPQGKASQKREVNKPPRPVSRLASRKRPGEMAAVVARPPLRLGAAGALTKSFKRAISKLNHPGNKLLYAAGIRFS
jgi:hypothetical protein